jgi:hypothetical protein
MVKVCSALSENCGSIEHQSSFCIPYKNTSIAPVVIP